MSSIDEKINIIKKLILNHSINESNYNYEELNSECDLIYDLEYNSINFIELIIDLEQTFDIIFDEELLIIDELSKIENIIKVTLKLIDPSKAVLI